MCAQLRIDLETLGLAVRVNTMISSSWRLAFVKANKTSKFVAFNELQNSLVIEIHPEGLVPQNEPPMFNKIGWLQNILCINPIDVDGTIVFK